MILDTFQNRGIKRLVFILFCITVLFWQKISVVVEIALVQPVIPIDAILTSVTGGNIYLSAFLKILLLLMCSYAFIITLSLHDMLPKRKYLAVILFLAVTSVFADAQNIAGSVCALLFQQFVFYNIFRTYHSDKIKSSVFTAAFFAGISIMFSFSFIIIIISLIAGILIFGIATWRCIISMITGLLAPFVFALYFFQIAYHDVNLMLHSIGDNLKNISFSMIDFNNFSSLFLISVFIAVLLSLLKAIKYTKPIQKMENRLFYFTFVISVIVVVFVSGLKPYGVMMFGLSAAYLLARFSQLVRREWIAEFTVFAVLIAAVVYNNQMLFNNNG
ncbi:MAG: DUF6427 family protein [Prevotellaceae bacterium]|jgi:hypothetical protein|nr:DUF6427 family protein [Prevotellaceae bacterium]